MTVLDDAYELTPGVALRPEPFGALAYHFGNRRLTFLRTPELVALVRLLGSAPDTRSALESVGIAEAQWPAYGEALVRLAEADMIRPRS